MKIVRLIFLILILLSIAAFLFATLPQKLLLSKIMIGLAVGLIYADSQCPDSGLKS